MLYGHSHRRGSEILDFIGKLSADFSPSRPHGCGEIEHFQAFGIDLYFFNQTLNMFDSFGCIGISFQEMTLPIQSASHKNTVNPSFKCPQEIGLVKLSCAWHTYDFDIKGVRQPHDTG